MKDRSTLGSVNYMFEYAAWCLPLLYWYNHLLFRCLSGFSYKESRRILWFMMVLSVLICGFVLFKRARTGRTVALALLLPFGLYTAICYRKVLGIRLMLILGIACGISLLYGLYVMRRKIKGCRKGRIFRRRLCRWFAGTAYVFGAAMLLILTPLMIRSIFGGTVLRPSEVAVSGAEEMDEDEYTSNIEKMMKLQGDEWAELNPQERLNVLQSAVNVETVYFGLPHEINVEAVNSEEYDRAAYSDAAHTIYINLGDLENGSSAEMLEACCREVYHCYEYRIVELYVSADTETRSLRMYNNASAYAEEFFWFVYDSGPVCEYYGRQCEDDAQEYAELAVDYYAYVFQERLMETEVATCVAEPEEIMSGTV